MNNCILLFPTSTNNDKGYVICVHFRICLLNAISIRILQHVYNTNASKKSGFIHRSEIKTFIDTYIKLDVEENYGDEDGVFIDKERKCGIF